MKDWFYRDGWFFLYLALVVILTTVAVMGVAWLT